MGFFLGLVRVLLVSLLVTAVAADECKKPRIRREWRKLTPRERAEWINAINVTRFPVRPMSKILTSHRLVHRQGSP